ncbi:unnamed protein product [Staurois parvus]|uniref:Uncharacterized protein n=1 Tax=Staurois parvus TaxID=386267 RepID=A0ABN9DL27_9NEOB|nr:unnamed protein product [Staurois parvus]
MTEPTSSALSVIGDPLCPRDTATADRRAACSLSCACAVRMGGQHIM